MNKHGQSLITFVLILPIIVLFLAFIIDSGMMIVEKENVDGLLSNNMQMAVRKNVKDIEKIKKVIISNNGNLQLDIEISNNTLYINAIDNKKSIFGKIIDLSWYNLRFNYCINYQDQKLNKNCEKVI